MITKTSSAWPGPGTDSYSTQFQSARNLAPTSESKGSETPRAAIENDAEPVAVASPKMPGQGMNPAQIEPSGKGPASLPTTEESPVVMPQDQKILDGEGNVTDASSAVDGMKSGAVAPHSKAAAPQSLGKDDNEGDVDEASEVAKDYQAPGPDAPGPSNTQDPLAVQIDALRLGEPAAGSGHGEGLAPSPQDTVLRSPTGISPEIGGRMTEDEGSVI